MKPWEETWRLDAEYPSTSGAEVRLPGEGSQTRSAQFGRECGPAGAGWCEADEHDVARARLASAAPDMARVLLSLEWSGDESDCPVCGRWRDVLGNPGHHEPDCPLDVALRKAGVR